jgi:hypothetical protein
MRTVNIEIYLFQELSPNAKIGVLCWLDNDPLEYETENGEIKYQSFFDMSETDVIDHCEINNYEFWAEGKIF